MIAGTGALACIFGARFSAVGLPVTLLGTWREGIHALQENGIRVIGLNGELQSFPVRATDNPDECHESKMALVLVKTWQTERAAGQLAHILSPTGLALTLQNGLGNVEILTDALGEARVAAGTVTLGAALVAPGIVRSQGQGLVNLGERSRIGEWEAILRRAGFGVQIEPDLQRVVWRKLAANAAINPLSALLDATNGQLRQSPAAMELIHSVIRETIDVAGHKGIPLSPDETIRMVDTVLEQTAGNISSMVQDLRREAPTEIDAINGAIVLTGETLGVSAPANRLLWQLIRSKVELQRITTP